MTDVLWARAEIYSVDIGLVETYFSGANPSERKILWRMRDALLQDLASNFPFLKVNDREKYALLLDQLKTSLPFLDLWYKFKYL